MVELTSETGWRRHHWPTVLAIGLVVYVLAKLVHEAIGHGLACELMGFELKGFSSSWCDCEKEPLREAATRVVKGAGTLANLLVGAGALVAVVRGSFRAGVTLYFVWLTAAVNLLMGGGYLMVDPLFLFGDWGQFVDGLEPNLPLRLALAGLGVAISLGTFFLLRAPFQRLLGATEGARKRQARLLCWMPYFLVGGLAMTGAALLNSLGPIYAVTSALATLGGTFLVVWIPSAVDPPTTLAPPGLDVRRSRPWLLAGGAAVVFLFVAFGPGIEV